MNRLKNSNKEAEQAGSSPVKLDKSLNRSFNNSQLAQSKTFNESLLNTSLKKSQVQNSSHVLNNACSPEE